MAGKSWKSYLIIAIIAVLAVVAVMNIDAIRKPLGLPAPIKGV